MPASARTVLRACWAITGTIFVVFAAQALTGVGGAGVTNAFSRYLYPVLLYAPAGFCFARAAATRIERAAWALLGLAVAGFASAYVVITFAYAGEPPLPSAGDVLSLAFYPCAAAAMLLLVRSRLPTVRSGLWLDGAIGALAIMALACALVYGPVLREIGGSLSPGVVTGFAYPLSDLVLIGFVVGIFGVLGWRPSRMWLVLGAGLVVLSVADGIYLYSVVHGNYVSGPALSVAWLSSALLVGAAGWQPVRRESAPSTLTVRVMLVPVACGLIGIGLLASQYNRPLQGLTLALTAATLLLVMVRASRAFAENRQMLAHSREEARTDALTGLRNRRSLMDDLETELPAATPADPRALVLFDLNGFKQYNDSFGHPAGDRLLVLLGRRLGNAVVGHGTAYRLGGDEFCVLLRPGRGGAEAPTGVAVDALAERGEGFEVTTSFGIVIVPDETTSPTEALQIADRRMYANKAGGRVSARHQSRDVLLQSLSESQPRLHKHLQGTANLALAVARKLDMPPEQLDEVARAAELHDIGMVAIPQEILDKPAPLDEAEWGFVRQHPVIGERILLAAPALRPVASLVRASHERWDGTGYPDGLAGEKIPLGARVVAVCEAFDSMTREQPYRAALEVDAAVAELRRCAGTQFDPGVVDEFVRVIQHDPIRQDVEAPS